MADRVVVTLHVCKASVHCVVLAGILGYVHHTCGMTPGCMLVCFMML